MGSGQAGSGRAKCDGRTRGAPGEGAGRGRGARGDGTPLEENAVAEEGVDNGVVAHGLALRLQEQIERQVGRVREHQLQLDLLQLQTPLRGQLPSPRRRQKRFDALARLAQRVLEVAEQVQQLGCIRLDRTCALGLTQLRQVALHRLDLHRAAAKAKRQVRELLIQLPAVGIVACGGVRAAGRRGLHLAKVLSAQPGYVRALQPQRLCRL